MPRFAPATAATLLLALVLTGPAAAQGSRARTAPAGSPVGSGLAWNGLSAGQRTALRPLRELWPTLGAEDQRQWLAMARNFNRLSPAERSRLQQRMNDWARLSPTQRSRARLNFGEVRRVPRDERRERQHKNERKRGENLATQERIRVARRHRAGVQDCACYVAAGNRAHVRCIERRPSSPCGCNRRTTISSP